MGVHVRKNVNYTGGGQGSIEVDPTLSVEGKPADAKAVGDALNTKLGSGDVVDNLQSEATNLPLSAKQGKVLSDQLGGLTLYVMSEADFATIQEDTENGFYILYQE